MPITVTAVVYQNDGFWIAQCLEHDIVSFAETLEQLQEELRGQLEAVVRMDRQEGRVPFSGFEKAPAKFWQMYEEREARVQPIQPKVGIFARLRELVAPPAIRTRLIPAYL